MLSGVYPTLSNEDYHSDPAVSRSGLILFDESPYKYWAHYLNPQRPPRESTDAMDFGTAFHTLILEPDLFDREYNIEPEVQKLPKVGLLRDLGRPEYERQKAEREKTQFENDLIMQNFDRTKRVLSQKEWRLLREMLESLLAHKDAPELIEGAVYEQSYFWQDESGLMLKARPDILHANMIVDLKTIKSAHTRHYQAEMAKKGYHIQGAMCREGVYVNEGIDIPNVINICIEKEYPYEIGIKIISEGALDAGKQKYKEICVDLMHAITHNTFESYPVETIELPRWAE